MTLYIQDLQLLFLYKYDNSSKCKLYNMLLSTGLMEAVWLLKSLPGVFNIAF